MTPTPRLLIALCLLIVAADAAASSPSPAPAVGPGGDRSRRGRSIAMRPEQAPPSLPPSLPDLDTRRDDAVQPATFENPDKRPRDWPRDWPSDADETIDAIVSLVESRSPGDEIQPGETQPEPPLKLSSTLSPDAASAAPLADRIAPRAKQPASKSVETLNNESTRKLLAPTPRKPTVSPMAANSTPPLADFSWLPANAGSLSTTASAVALTVGLLLLLVAVLKKAAPRSARPLPEDVISLLGRVTLANKQSAQLMKVGGKLVLVAVTAEGAKPITEITDPDEVGRLMGLIEQANPHSASAAFREVFDQVSRESAPSGFLGDEAPSFAPASFGASPLIDRGQLAAAYANTPGGRADAA